MWCVDVRMICENKDGVEILLENDKILNFNFLYVSSFNFKKLVGRGKFWKNV